MAGRRRTAAADRRSASAARTLTDNRGGAGGFHDGLAWAMERGADLVWLMDDDGLPDARLPGHAARAPRRLRLLGPGRASTRPDPDRLVFPIRLPGGTRVVHRMADVEAAAVDGVIRDVVIPFNGVLVTRELVERIGTPARGVLHLGRRPRVPPARRAGRRPGRDGGRTRRLRHPSVGDLGTPMMFGRTTYNHTPSDLKHYCMARNNLVNLREYRGWPHALMFVAKTPGSTRSPGRRRPGCG